MQFPPSFRILSSTEMKFEINILPGYEKANIPEYWKEFFSKGTTTILKAIWEYSRLLLIDEIKRLNKKAHMEENKSLIQEYTRLLNENKNEIKQGGSLLRIGFGKTYYFNSIGYFLSNEEKEYKRTGGESNRFRNFYPVGQYIL